MTTKQSLSSVGFTRCAVCKIDLKGRFVYLDEKVETLLGYTKEELFGKSFIDFLDEPSQQLIESLLAQRNHYETFYDTANLTVYNRSRDTLAVRVIVSLNFIAGNPVNYQLIIECSTDRSAPQSPIFKSDNYKALIKEFLKIGPSAGWKDYLKVICRFTGAGQACIYLIHEESLQPRSAIDRDLAGDFDFNEIPEPGALHRHVARSGEEYSFIDGGAVQRVIEQGGTAPNEYVARLDLPDGTCYLARLLFKEEFDPHRIQSSLACARKSLELAARMIASGPPTSDVTGDGNEVRFTIGFLDSLNIAAFLADSDGSVIGYNPAALGIFSEKQLEGSYLDAVGCLAEFNAPDFTRPIVDYVNSSVEDEPVSEKLVLDIRTSRLEQARLTVLKLGNEPGDLSGCFVVEREPASDRPAVTYERSDLSMQVLTGLARRLKSTEDLAHKFSHEFFNQLSGKGNDRLVELSKSVRFLRSLVSALHRYAKLTRPSDVPSLIDLNLLVAEQIEKLKADHCDAGVNCTFKNLPKIVTQPRLLGQALGCILDNCFKYTDGPTAEITVTAESQDGRCRIAVTDKGFGISPRHLPNIFDLMYRAPDKKVQARDGHGIGLSMARKAILLLDGQIDISSKVGEGTIVQVTIPVE